MPQIGIRRASVPLRGGPLCSHLRIRCARTSRATGSFWPLAAILATTVISACGFKSMNSATNRASLRRTTRPKKRVLRGFADERGGAPRGE